MRVGLTRSAMFFTLAVAFAIPGPAATYTWEGDTSNAMSDGTNWTGDSIITTGVIGTDDLVFPDIGGTTVSTTPSVDVNFAFPKISVTGGAYTFGGASTLTVNTINSTPNPTTHGLLHTSASTLTIDAPFATIGGYVHSNGGGIIFNGTVAPGNNVNSANNWMQVDGSSNVSFNGAFSSNASAGAGNAINQLYFGATAINFDATAHMGNIGTAYTGRISLGVNSGGTISVEHNNGLGGRGGVGQGVQILSTTSGKMVLDPAAGGNSDLTLMDDLWFAGRSGANVNNPHFVNANGNNVYQSNDPSTVTLAVNSTGANATAGVTTTIKTTGGSLEFINASIGTNGTSTSSGAVSFAPYTYRFDTDANTSIKLTKATSSLTNMGIRQNSVGRAVTVVKAGAGTMINEYTTNNYTGTTTIDGGTYIMKGSHSVVPGTYTVNATGTLLVSGPAANISAPVIVAADGTLGGDGTVSGTVTIQSGGHVSPGNSAGKLTLTSDLTSDGGIYNWQLATLNDQTSGTAGTDFDQIVVGGNLALSGTPSIALDFSLLAVADRPAAAGAFWSSNHTWKIIDTATISGDPNSVSLTSTAGSGTWALAIGTGADLNDIFLNYTASVAALTGDVNNDHIVNQLDLNVVFGNWLSTGASLAQGDANNDGVVNQLDINTITGNWLATGPSSGLLGAATVPEPASTGLLACGILAVFGHAVRRRKSVRGIENLN